MKNLIYSSLIQIEKNSPELFLLIKGSKIEVSQDPKVTAYCAIKNESFLIVLGEKFCEGFSAYDLAALIEHESLHLVFEHLSDFEVIAKQDKTLLNIAQDAIINSLGEFFQDRKKLNKKLQSGIYFDKINSMLKQSKYEGPYLTAASHTSKQVFEVLKTYLKDDQKQDLEKSQFDDHLKQDEKLDKSQLKKDLQDFLDSKKQDLENLLEKKQGQGQDFKNFLNEIVKKRKDASFQKAVNFFIASQKAATFEGSWKRLSRRVLNQKGKIQVKKQKILLGFDVSGSMLDAETIEKMKKVISAALAQSFEVDLVFGDTKKQGFFKSLNKTFDFSQVRGGGGTDLSFMFDEKLSTYDGLIILTDGEFNHNCIKAKKNKVLFLLTYQGNDAKNLAKNFRSVFV